MRNAIILFSLLMGLTHCKNDAKDTGQVDDSSLNLPTLEGLDNSRFPASEGYQRLRGLMRQGGGVYALLESQTYQMYQLADSTNTLDSLNKKAVGPLTYDGEAVYIDVTGKPGPPSARTGAVFEVYKIDTLMAKTMENLAVLEFPFDFWVYGPDWELEITNFEGGLYYKNWGTNMAWRGAWVVPKYNGTSWIYDVPANEPYTGEMTVVIKLEKMTDPKTGKNYNYSGEVTANGQTFKGGAIRGLGQFPTE